MAQETLFEKVQHYLNQKPRPEDISPTWVSTIIGCNPKLATDYLSIIRRGFSSPQEYRNALKQQQKISAR